MTAKAKVQVHMYCGGPSSGKTSSLVHRVQTMIGNGVDPSRILFVCASSIAAQRMRHTLDNLGEGGDEVRAVSARALTLRLFAENEVATRMGYRARVLNPAEQAVFFEDMKSSGIKRKRIKEMTGFFERTYSDMAEDADDFPYEWEETGMLDYEHSYLRLYEATTEGRAACAVARELEENALFREKFGTAHVVVDDYQLLSRAAQHICRALAKQTLCVSFDECDTCSVDFRFPCSLGKNELLNSGYDVEETALGISYAAPRVCEMINVVRADEGMSAEALKSAAMCALESNDTNAWALAAATAALPPSGRISCETPVDELTTIARLVEEAHDCGIEYKDIAITSLSDVWLVNAKRFLRQKKVALDSPAQTKSMHVSFLSEKGNMCAYATTLLTLLAHPLDSAAWRSWCGFSSYTANSAVFMRIKTICVENKYHLRQALAYLAHGEFPDLANLPEASHVIERFNQGCNLIEQLSGLLGQGLVEALEAECVRMGCKKTNDFRRLLGQVAVQDTAVDLLDKLQHHLFFPEFSENNAVKVVPPEMLSGLKPRVLILCGAVNGFAPVMEYFDITQTDPEHQALIRRKCVARLYAAAKVASQHFYVTNFTNLKLEEAERLKLEVERVYAHEGTRWARVSPSVVTQPMAEIDSADDDMPCVVKGNSQSNSQCAVPNDAQGNAHGAVQIAK